MNTKALLKRNIDTINEDNCRVSEIFEILIAFCTAMLLVVSMFREEYEKMYFFYWIFLFASVGFFIFTRIYVRKHLKYTTVVSLMVMILAYSYSIFSGIIFNLDGPSITVYALMAVSCSAFLAPFSFVLIFHTSFCIIYCALCLLLKPEYGVQDTINFVIFLVMSIVVSTIVYKNKIEYIISVEEIKKKNIDRENLLNNIPGGVGVIDIVDGVATKSYMNTAYYKMILGVDDVENLQNNSDILSEINELDITIAKEKIKTIVDGAENLNFIYKAARNKKKDIWIRIEGSVASREENHIVLYCVFTNITDIYIKLEEELDKTSKALEKAKEADAAKTEFYARMSHDMRTPMNGILGMTTLSKEETDLKILHHNLDMIEASGHYMLSIINDSLDMQRIETGKLTLVSQVFYAKDFIENISSMMRPTALQKGVEFIVTNININLDCFFKGDGVRFKQIFMNLLSNAIKFTPKGGRVEIQMECLKHDTYMDYDVFRIIDNGVGMSQEYIDNHIFSAFQQETNMMTGKYVGSGLGLAITKSLVDMMGGSISVESEKDKGTVFTVEFHIELVDKNQEEYASSTDQKEQQKDVDLKGKHILLCEDHPINAEITMRLLSKLGAEIEVAENGAEGLRKFEESELYFYDIVLMDIRMPVMDGLTAATAIRNSSREDGKTLPIIAMTANAYQEDIQRTLNAGMNAHISKPVDAKILYSVLEKYVGN